MKPIRVLHVLGAMNRGGVETWLMHVLRHIDRERFQIDFLVHTDRAAAYDEEILALNSRIFCCPHTHNPARYAAQFVQIVRQNGPFDVLHSHVQHYSGFVLSLGRLAGIPVRIAHSHNDTRSLDAKAGFLRSSYLKLTSRLIAANSTHGVAVSEGAGTSLYGASWGTDHRFQILYCGVEAELTNSTSNRAAVRQEFGFTDNDVVIGQVGRFTPQKNHGFLLEIAAEIASIQSGVKFLCVGDGPLRFEIQARAHALGLDGHVIFAGLRSDVQRLMNGMDLLLVPSLHEGLPLVLLEAQAAGVTSLVSEGIPQEAVIHPALVRRFPLSAGAGAWARMSYHLAKEPRFDRRDALELFKSSSFEISRAVQNLCSMYLE